MGGWGGRGAGAVGTMASTPDVEKLFQENQEREQALRNLLKTRPSESRDVSGGDWGWLKW